jgi:hypothetical protein
LQHQDFNKKSGSSTRKLKLKRNLNLNLNFQSRIGEWRDATAAQPLVDLDLARRDDSYATPRERHRKTSQYLRH